MNKERLIRPVIYTAGGLLLALGLVNLAGGLGSAQSLALPDPLFGIPLRIAMMLAGGTELTVSLICLFGKRLRLQTALIAWLASNFIGYRIGLQWQGCHKQWGCLGNWAATLNISSNVADVTMTSIMICLLLGGGAATIWFWHSKNPPGRAALPRRPEIAPLKSPVLPVVVTLPLDLKTSARKLPVRIAKWT